MATISHMNIIKKTIKIEQLHIKLPKHNVKGGIQGNIGAFKFIDNDTKQYVIYIPSLEISGYGETEDKAREMLKFSLDDFYQYLVSLPSGQINEELVKLGWEKSVLHKDYSKSYIDSKGKLNNVNAENGKVEQVTLIAA